jgi:integrase
LNALKKFRQYKDIEFKNLNYKTLQEFRESMMEDGKKENTISIHLRTLRAVYNSAINENIVPKSFYPFESFKIKSEKTLKRAITKDEINAIRKLKIPERSELDKARDYFLFSFNLRGISFIDIAYLRCKDIKNDRVTYSRKKTGQKFSIKLTEEAHGIIKKYSDLKDPEKYIFPIIQRKDKEYLDYRNAMRLTNKKLKTIGEMVDLKIPLSTYVSRHSWATIGKRAGLSTSIISEGLGHDSEKTTQIYLDSFEDKILDDANELITN